MDLPDIKKAIQEIVFSATQQNAPGKVNLLMQISDCLKNALETKDFVIARARFVPSIKDKIAEAEAVNLRLLEELHLHESLLSEERELKARWEALAEKKTRLDALRILAAEMSNLDPNSIGQDIDTVHNSVTSSLPVYISSLELVEIALGKAAPEWESLLSTPLTAALDNLRRLQEGQNAALEKLSAEPLDTKWTAFSSRYIDLAVEYNLHVDKLKEISRDLSVIEEKHAQIMEAFRAHQLENDSVYGVLHKRDGGGLLQYAAALTGEIKTQLQQYDDRIRQLVQQRDQLPLFDQYEMSQYQC